MVGSAVHGVSNRWRRGVRRSKVVVATCAGAVALGACSPADQSAVTLDMATGRPTLILVLCPGEVVSAVELSAAATNADGFAVDGEVLWRATASEPQRVTRIVAGVSPAGFTDAVPERPFEPHARLVRAQRSPVALLPRMRLTSTRGCCGLIACSSTTLTRAATSCCGRPMPTALTTRWTLWDSRRKHCRCSARCSCPVAASPLSSRGC